MLATIRPALVMILFLTLITGIGYPLAITVIAGAVMPGNANGSLIEKDGKVIGSALIAQNFTAPGYFHPRPSAAGKDGYDAANSSGSNLAPSSRALVERVAEGVAGYRDANKATTVPMDAITTSGSGLDPHISPANAKAQAGRVAAARDMPEAEVAQLIERHTDRPFFNLLGEPAVNVLLLNLALDEAKPVRR